MKSEFVVGKWVTPDVFVADDTQPEEPISKVKEFCDWIKAAFAEVPGEYSVVERYTGKQVIGKQERMKV